MKSLFKLSVCRVALVVALASFTSSARADVIVSQTSNNGSIQVQAFQPLGQSFTAATDTLLGFDFYFLTYNPQFANNPITMDIRQGAGTGGTILDTVTFSLGNGFNGWAGGSFMLGLTTGQVYTATLSTTSPYWGLEWSNGLSLYADGTAFTGGVANNADFMFQARFADSVPETGSTVGLCGAALLGLALVRRKLAK